MARTFSVTGIVDGKVVSGLRLTGSQIRAGLLGGRNRSGEFVSGGWDSFTCDECGENATRCPKLGEFTVSAYRRR